MNKHVIPAAMILVVFLWLGTGLLSADADIVVQLRLYQGMTQSGESSGVIVSSYYLKKMEGGEKIIPFTDVKEEADHLTRIYKLDQVKQVARLDVVLYKDKANKLDMPLKLNDRDLVLNITNEPGKKDRFQVSITEKGKSKSLMESEIIVPEKKTAVLGFKDSAQKIYFLAFNRKNGQGKADSLAAKLGAQSVEPPKLVFNVEPVYPKVALEESISGEVVVKGFTDDTGSVAQLNVLEGHNVLRTETMQALKKWKYAPWKVDGVAKPVHFSMIFIYNLDGAEVDDAAIVEKYEPLIKANKPDTDLPQIMEMVLVNGKSLKKAAQEKNLTQTLKAKKVESPKLVRRIEPVYPADADKFATKPTDMTVKTVIIHAKTDVSGRVNGAKVLSGPEAYRLPSLNAVKKWQFTPWRVDGVAKKVEFLMICIYPMNIIPDQKVSAVVNQALLENRAVIDNAKTKDQQMPMLQEVVLVNPGYAE